MDSWESVMGGAQEEGVTDFWTPWVVIEFWRRRSGGISWSFIPHPWFLIDLQLSPFNKNLDYWVSINKAAKQGCSQTGGNDWAAMPIKLLCKLELHSVQTNKKQPTWFGLSMLSAVRMLSTAGNQLKRKNPNPKSSEETSLLQPPKTVQYGILF